MVRNLLKGGVLHDNDWVKHSEVNCESSDKVILPLADLQANPDLLKNYNKVAIAVGGGDDIEALRPYLSQIAFIAVDFPAFNDGRGYSLARLARRKLQWRGELRAIGNVLADQYAYLLECGFDAFEIDPNRQPPELFASAASAIGLRYQHETSPAPSKNIWQTRHQQ